MEKVIRGEDLLPSENDYDWLGHGAYFWGNDPKRALDFASMLQQHPEFRGKKGVITKPAVVGAVIDLGHCLNLMTASALGLVDGAYKALSDSIQNAGGELPRNTGGADLLYRRLDCAVIEFLHYVRADTKQRSFDTARGLFFEGRELYPNAGFRTKDHIQVCVRNPNCIKGFFRPRSPNNKYQVP